MLPKIKKIGMYLLVAGITNVVYGFILYSLFTWLAGYSLFHAYIGNLLFIVFAFAIDEYTQKTMQSEKIIMRMKKEKDREAFYRSLEKGLSSVWSFKADLYLFYVIILLLSQIIEFNPSIVDESISNFIRANDYSILLLVAFDTLIAQVSKDRGNMNKVLAKLKKSMTDTDD